MKINCMSPSWECGEVVPRDGFGIGLRLLTRSPPGANPASILVRIIAFQPAQRQCAHKDILILELLWGENK